MVVHGRQNLVATPQSRLMQQQSNLFPTLQVFSVSLEKLWQVVQIRMDNEDQIFITYHLCLFPTSLWRSPADFFVRRISRFMIPPVNYLSPTAEIQKTFWVRTQDHCQIHCQHHLPTCCAEDNWTSFLLCKIELTVTGSKCWGAAPLFQKVSRTFSHSGILLSLCLTSSMFPVICRISHFHVDSFCNDTFLQGIHGCGRYGSGDPWPITTSTRS